MISDYLNQLRVGKDFTEAEAAHILEMVLMGDLSDGQIAGILVGFSFKGATADELTGFARVMRQQAVKLNSTQQLLIDTAGTGGGICTFNISTTSAFVIAGAGLTVAKHGNTSFTSKCGSADVLKELGIKLDPPRQTIEKCLNEIGIGFLFAPNFHPSMKRVAMIRKQLGIKTVFNLLGPINNPAGAKLHVLGVYESNLTELVAGALHRLGSERAWVVHSADGMDEISPCDETKITELRNGQITSFYIHPEDLGLSLVDANELTGGDSVYNANVTLGVLKGDIRTGPRAATLLNAAAGLFVGGMATDLKEALELAKESIDSGDAMKKLEALRKMTNGT